MREWWPAVFMFTLLIALSAGLYYFAFPRQTDTGQPLANPGGEPLSQEQQEQVDRFWLLVEQRQPEYVLDEVACPVDGAIVKVGRLADPQRDNRFGGVAGDLMQIALAPPPGGLGQPEFTQQDWMQLPGTCPACGATWMEGDITAINLGRVPLAADKAKDWDLTALLPTLAAVPHDQWTDDERLFVRYLTCRQAGFPAFELGFYALWCAYGSNFGSWYGTPKEVAAPSAGYYALAAAEFKRELLDAASHANDHEQAVAAMTMGECYRLLGMHSDAADAFKKARSYSVLDDITYGVLKQLEDWQAQGDSELHRVHVEDTKTPPTGWYIEQMLPAINAHINEHREQWVNQDDPQQLADKLRASIEKFEQQRAAAAGR